MSRVSARSAKVLVVAGEASADLHAAHVFAGLQAEQKVDIFGIGGDALVKLGLDPVAHASEMAVVGLTEAISRIPRSLALLRELEERAAKEKPDFAFLVDLPDFNLRLAPRLKRLGVPVVYFVSPQVWAWRANRVHAMAKCIDRLLCILPFERAWYAERAPRELRVDYVGHPAIEEIPVAPYEPDTNLVALLPGSRVREIRSLFPELIVAAARLKRERPNLRFVLPLAPTLRANAEVRELLRNGEGEALSAIRELGNAYAIVESQAHEVLRRARLALVASGTATLETAIVGTPMVVVYRVSPLTAFIFKNFVGYRGPVAMANILHCGLNGDERVVPELLQDEVSAAGIAAAAARILDDPAVWQAQASRLAGTRALLTGGIGSPTKNVINALREFL